MFHSIKKRYNNMNNQCSSEDGLEAFIALRQEAKQNDL